MKIKFTEADMDAIEAMYYDNEGYIPRNTNHIPKEKEYQIIQLLYLRMLKEWEKEQS